MPIGPIEWSMRQLKLFGELRIFQSSAELLIMSMPKSSPQSTFFGSGRALVTFEAPHSPKIIQKIEEPLETVNGFGFHRVFGFFWPLFGSKIGSKEPKNRLKPNPLTSLLRKGMAVAASAMGSGLYVYVWGWG